MAIINNSLHFYKHYYSSNEIKWNENSDDEKKTNNTYFEKQNKKLLDNHLPDNVAEILNVKIDAQKGFELVTTYPGLITGAGIEHGSGLLGEIKLGFFFDHTNGLPLISGASLKGVLRSVFPGAIKKKISTAKNEKERVILDDKRKGMEAYILDLLKSESEYEEWNANHIYDLEKNIFGGEKAPSKNKVIFYDAFPVSTKYVRINGKKSETYLGLDFITPHYPNLLKNPVPIQFLKVLPGVSYYFHFDIPTIEICGITVEQNEIKELFKSIIKDIGIGAKTNVGYGQFIEKKL